ncbi:uncharacterized protein I206_105177 [Kwoniella pini CBS 10737]|uniref:Uncharacterized protein n=1 Tax=Kwoniella pini CBS 10737 TaxID=1296096 RepID=A0A1B9I516_9TREE|nr:uncharacterized protein I206_03914 [Kwoniella pini CBS 10737]OCF50589.1 hypothetical protein I206_03914 [Kwoniella pini CBS 10737]
MSHLYDRKNSRSLTIPELWTCWDIMIDDPVREAKLIAGTLGQDSLPKEALNDEVTYKECKIFNNLMATILDMIKANENKFDTVKKLKILDIGYRAGISILCICFAMDVGFLQRALRRIAQIKSMIEDLDKNKTIAPMKRELRKLHDDLIKYCKNRDPDHPLFEFDYRFEDAKYQFMEQMMRERFGFDMDMD